MRNTFIKSLSSLSQDDDNIYVVCGDAGFGVFEKFKEGKPDRFINTGVAEANMIGYAAGMSLVGYNVFVYNIIPFLLYRCYEQVRNDICYQRLPVTLVGIGSGVTYAPGGMTHYSIEDIALAYTLPSLSIISPVDPVETEAAIRYAADHDGPLFIRLAKSGEPVFRKDDPIDITLPAIVLDGKDVVIFSYGSIFSEAAKAAEILSSDGVTLRVISVPMLRPLNKSSICDLIKGFDTVMVLEEHYLTGGLASRMAEIFIARGIKSKLIPLTLPDHFLHDVRSQAGMRRKYGIDARAIAETVKSHLKGEPR